VIRDSRFLAQLLGIGVVKRQSLISLGSSLGITLLGYLATVYIAHYLGAGPLGAFFLFIAYWNFLSFFTDCGVSAACVQRISEGKNINEYFSAHLLVRIILTTIVSLALIIAYPYAVDLVSSGLYWLLIPGLIIGLISGSIGAGVYGIGKVGITQISDLTNSAVKVAVQIFAVIAGFGAFGLVGGFIAGIAAGSIVNYRFFRLHLSGFHWEHLINLKSFAFWSFCTGIIGVVMGYADTLIIGYYLNNSDVGFYKTAAQFASIAFLATAAFRASLYPRISHWNSIFDPISIADALSRACTYSLVFTIPAVVGATIFADKILYFFYGSPFIVAAPVLVILLFMQFPSIIVNLEAVSLSAQNRPGLVFKASFLSSVVMVLLNVTLVPLYGINGAAVATLIATIVYAVFAHYEHRKLIQFKVPSAVVIRVGISAFLMAVVLALIRLVTGINTVFELFLSICVGAIIFVIVFLKLCRGIRNELASLIRDLGIPFPGWL